MHPQLSEGENRTKNRNKNVNGLFLITHFLETNSVTTGTLILVRFLQITCRIPNEASSSIPQFHSKDNLSVHQLLSLR
jgi:hypothetical protein